MPAQLFYTTGIPVCLWFLTRDKTGRNLKQGGRDRNSETLFIDARNIFTQIDRAHRELNDEQVQNVAVIPRLHKGRRPEFVALIDRYFQQGLARFGSGRKRGQRRNRFEANARVAVFQAAQDGRREIGLDGGGLLGG